MFEARPLLSPEAVLVPKPTSADDIVVMISDVLFDYLPIASETEPDEVIGRVLEILESPPEIEIYENEMAWRRPRDVDRRN